MVSRVVCEGGEGHLPVVSWTSPRCPRCAALRPRVRTTKTGAKKGKQWVRYLICRACKCAFLAQDESALEDALREFARKHPAAD